MTNAIVALGVTLKRNGETIAEVKQVNGVKLSRALLDATNFATADFYKEWVPGIKDGGKLAIEGNFIAGDTLGQVGLIADWEAGTYQTFVLTWPTSVAVTYSFTGIVEDVDFSPAKVGDLISFKATIQVNAKGTLGIGVSTGLSALTGIEETGTAALTFVPSFLAGTLFYAAEINTASDWIKLTPTAAAHTIVVTALGVATTVLTTQQSGQITLDVAGTVTPVYISAHQAGKAPQLTTLYIARP